VGGREGEGAGTAWEWLFANVKTGFEPGIGRDRFAGGAFCRSAR